MDNVITKRCSKQSHGCPWQGCKATNHTVTLRNLPNPASGTYTSAHRNSPEPSRTFRSLPPQHTPTRTGTLRNLLEARNPAHRNSPEPSKTCLHQHTPQLSGTFRNLPPEPTPAHTGTLQPSGTFRNLRNVHQHTPELSGTFRNLPPEPRPARALELSGTFRNLHQHTPELLGTFRNLPPEPTPAHTGTLRNLPEPSSGTCSCDPHRHTHRSLSGLKTPLAYAVGEKKDQKTRSCNGKKHKNTEMFGKKMNARCTVSVKK